MPKVMIQVPRGLGPMQVEIPEFKLNHRGRQLLDNEGKPVPFGERSVVGALHLRPNSTAIISEDEHAYLKGIGVPVVELQKVADENSLPPTTVPEESPRERATKAAAERAAAAAASEKSK